MEENKKIEINKLIDEKKIIWNKINKGNYKNDEQRFLLFKRSCNINSEMIEICGKIYKRKFNLEK